MVYTKACAKSASIDIRKREKEVFSHARRKDQRRALATQSRGWRKIKDWLLHSMLKRLGLAAALVLCLQARLIIFRHPLGIVGLAIGIPRPPVSCLHSPSSYLVCICNLPGSTLREPHFASSKKAASAKSLALFLSKIGNFYWELDSLLLGTIRGSVFSTNVMRNYAEKLLHALKMFFER